MTYYQVRELILKYVKYSSNILGVRVDEIKFSILTSGDVANYINKDNKNIITISEYLIYMLVDMLNNQDSMFEYYLEDDGYLLLLKIINHELYHIYQYNIIKNMTTVDDENYVLYEEFVILEELLEFYKDNHDNFRLEILADIFAYEQSLEILKSDFYEEYLKKESYIKKKIKELQNRLNSISYIINLDNLFIKKALGDIDVNDLSTNKQRRIIIKKLVATNSNLLKVYPLLSKGIRDLE
ncbi:MAG: hypothetical protein Q4G04_05245 [bacterium]|nr:hypothetical protein [bacterium]